MRAKLTRANPILAVLLLAGTAPVQAEEAASAALSGIRQESTERSTRLVLESTGPLAYTYFSPDPLTLVVDIPDVDASRLPARTTVGTPEVESVQVTPMARADGRNLARLEVRLASLVPYQIYSKDRALNLVFQRKEPVAVAEAPAAAEPAASAPVETAEAPPVQEPPAAPPVQAAAPQTEPEPMVPVAPVTADAAEPDVAPPSQPATQVLSVTADNVDGRIEITVRADGRLDYQDFFLGNPDRLVLDLKGVVTRAPRRVVEVQQGPVLKLRVAQFSASNPKVARVVADLSSRAPYRIVDAADGLKILFGEGSPAAPAPLASRRPAPAPVAPPIAALDVAPAAVVAAPPVAALARDPLPPPSVVPPMAAPQDTGALGSGSALEDRSIGVKKTYTGHPISMDFKDGDLQDIFRLFADISGLNVVVNPGVSGKVTLKLTEVPWDQALDLILKTNGLGYTLEDNVIRIARLSDLQKEEQDKRKLEEEKALAGTLEVWRKPLSYAKASDLEPTIKKVSLSARGSITLDTRTNTMIITDLPSNLEKARDLIADLDRATPQVEIEARIVVTTRNFTRDIGVQWGFLSRQTPTFGTTTGRDFPNAIILNGQGTPSTGGLPADQGGLASDEGIGTSGRGYAINLPASAFNSSLGISLGNVLGSFNLDAALTALERQGRGRLLSTPKVTTQNNQEAEIKQGIQIPIQTIANNTVTVQFKDAVLTLKVTPQITSAGTVLLKVEVENNSPDFANRVNGIPPINTQSAKTNVLVADGATTVIGGIYQSNEQTALNQTPFFSRIPILGHLFRNKLVTSQNNELLLFITPRITKG
jgi:type IV pilus assembly protein PilQ